MRGIIGHQAIAKHLQRAFACGRLAHAYLLTGPPSIGKTTLALALARTATCTAPLAERPCESCRACRHVERRSHPDVLLVEAGRNLGENDPTSARTKVMRIEQMRILRQAAALSPLAAPARFFIIRNAEDLTPEAGDALLKTLEEPTSQSYFVLTALDPSLLPPTLVSRCQRLALRPVPRAEIVAALHERTALPPEEVERIAHLAQGRAGWALRAAKSTRFREAHDALRKQLMALCHEDDHERLAYAATLAERYERDRDALDEPLRVWGMWWRDVLLTGLGCGDGIVNVDSASRLRAVATQCPPAAVRDYLWQIAETARLIRSDAHAHLVPDAPSPARASVGLPTGLPTRILWPTGSVNARLALDVLFLRAPRLTGVA